MMRFSHCELDFTISIYVDVHVWIYTLHAFVQMKFLFICGIVNFFLS